MRNWIGNINVSMLFTSAASIVLVQGYATANILSPGEVNERAKLVTVQITGESDGSGVIIARNRDIYTVLTNWHVVKNSVQYSVITHDGKIHDIDTKKIIRLDGADVALIYFKSPIKSYEFAEKGDADDLTEGQRIYYTGYPAEKIPGSGSYRIYPQSLIGFVPRTEVIHGYELIFTGEPISGFSGGPIFNENAQLVGIYGSVHLVSQESNTGNETLSRSLYGIPINTAIELAAQSSLSFGPPIAASPGSIYISPERQAEINSHINLGDNYLDKGQYKKAIDSYKNALVLNPNQVSAYRQIGLTHLIQQNYDEAIVNLTEALGIDPEDQASYMYRGISKLFQSTDIYRLIYSKSQISNYTSARTFFQSLGFQGLEGLGGQFPKVGLYDDLSKALDLGFTPRSGRDSFYRAIAKISSRSYGTAEAYLQAFEPDFKNAIRQNLDVDSTIIGYFAMGMIQHTRGNIKKANSYFNELVRISSDINFGYFMRGANFWASGNHQAAADDFKIVAVNENSPEIYALIGFIYIESQQFKTAKQFCDKAVELDSKHPGGFLCRGVNTSILEGNCKKSLADMQMSRSLGVQSNQVLNNIYTQFYPLMAGVCNAIERRQNL